jgi:hypothetical protein
MAMIIFPHTMASDKLIQARCGRVMIVWLEGPLEMANSLVGPSSKAAHKGEYRARMLDQP